MKKLTTIFLASILLLFSCNKENTTLQLPLGESFTTQINLVVEDMSVGTKEVGESYPTQQIQTKSSLAEEPSTEIKNLWVIQFGSDGRAVGVPKYIHNYGVGEGLTNEVKLIPSGGVDNTIVYLANTFNDDLLTDLIAKGLSLESLGSLGYKTVDELGCFTSDGTAKYMVMSGSITCPITPSEGLNTCILKRNVAKISLRIENSAGLTFNTISIKGVSNKLLYYTNRATALPDKLPEDDTFSNINYNSEDMADKSEFTFYVPMNMRGVVSNDSESQKNHYATPLCTAVQLIAATNEGKALGYTVYIGGNLTNDFNIQANKHYHYTLNFEQEGDPEVDTRIEDLSGVDFTSPLLPRSNCYILNPSSIADAVFYIPIDRIDEFWGDPIYVENESARSNNVLASVGDNWEVKMLWHDSQTLNYDTETGMLGGLKLEKAVSPAGKDAVKVTLPTSFANRDNHCNVAYVVRRKDGDNDILWSWHLWITDYDPYPDNLTPSHNIYKYQVEGGELHRYNNIFFKTGIYSRKLIMDRNLGARSADFEGHGAIINNMPRKPGTLYYQFGRKDPFPRITRYLNGYAYGTDDDINSKRNFEYAVSKPYEFVITYYDKWCSNESVRYNTNLWHDYKITAAGYTTGKSIFDPSPLGFRVPIHGTWHGFTGSNEADETLNPDDYNFLWTRYFNPIPDKYNYGRLYENFAYYPSSGLRSNSNGNLLLSGYGYIWSATGRYSTSGYILYFSSTYVGTSADRHTAVGLPVRPIQE